MLTFIEERRRRLRKVREEGRKEGQTEVILSVINSDPRIAALLREDPKIRRTLRERGIELPDELNGES